MPTIETAAITASVFVGLYVGGHIGDHAVQTNTIALTKATPTDDRLATGANPWAGWPACLYHAGTTVLTQLGTLLIVCVVAPLTVAGAAAALMVSGASHAVIDRRWLVQMIIRAKGGHDWDDGPYLIDQSLHHGSHLVAAVMAATVTTPVGTTVTGVAVVVLIGSALAVERYRACSADSRRGDPTRL